MGSPQRRRPCSTSRSQSRGRRTATGARWCCGHCASALRAPAGDLAVLKDRTPGRQSGFTLLEMLVVIVVLGFLVIGLTQGVRAGMALWHAQQRRVGETAELDASARVLRSLLTGAAAPIPGGFGPGTAAGGGIKGDANHLTFIGNLPTGLGVTRRADISIELHDGRLVLRWTPRLHEIPFGPPPQPTVT